MATFVSIIISIPLGILCSIVAWWVLFHGVSPKVEFSNRVGKLPTDDSPSGFRYRIKIRNIGARDAIDLQFHAFVRVKGLSPEFPNNISILRIETDTGHVVRMGRKKGNRIVRLHPEKTTLFDSARFPPEFRTKQRDGTLTLEDVLSLGNSAFLKMHVFAYDEFSGSRKL